MFDLGLALSARPVFDLASETRIGSSTLPVCGRIEGKQDPDLHFNFLHLTRAA